MKVMFYDAMQIYCLLMAGGAFYTQSFWSALFWMTSYIIWNHWYCKAVVQKGNGQ